MVSNGDEAPRFQPTRAECDEHRNALKARLRKTHGASIASHEFEQLEWRDRYQWRCQVGTFPPIDEVFRLPKPEAG
jgi:hypothetical protein